MSFCDITWENRVFSRLGHSPRGTQPASEFRRAVYCLWAVGLYVQFPPGFFLYQRDWKVKNYGSPIPSAWKPRCETNSASEVHLCLIQKLEGRRVIISATVVMGGWAVADEASCEEAGVCLPLGGAAALRPWDQTSRMTPSLPHSGYSGVYKP